MFDFNWWIVSLFLRACLSKWNLVWLLPEENSDSKSITFFISVLEDATCQPLRKGRSVLGRINQSSVAGNRQQKLASAFHQQHGNFSQVWALTSDRLQTWSWRSWVPNWMLRVSGAVCGSCRFSVAWLKNCSNLEKHISTHWASHKYLSFWVIFLKQLTRF